MEVGDMDVIGIAAAAEIKGAAEFAVVKVARVSASD